MDNFIDYDKKFLNFSMRQSLLSKKDEIEYIKNWQAKKDQKSLNKIVSSHLRLVISIANKFKNYGLMYVWHCWIHFQPKREQY